MLKRDYIMKLVQQMLDALMLLLNEQGLDDVDKQKSLERFYSDYLGERREFYIDSELVEIVNYLTQKYGDELMLRLDMLSEIMYQDGMLERNMSERVSILKSTFSILLYLRENDNTYSLIREGKIDSIRKELEQLQ